MPNGSSSSRDPHRDRTFTTPSFRVLACALAILGATPPALAGAEPQLHDPVPGAIMHWQVSPAFDPFRLSAESPPEAKHWESSPGTSITADEHGVVDLARHVPRRSSGTSRAWVRATISADAAVTRRLQLSHSGDLSLFVNRQLVLRATHPSNSSPATPTDETIAVALRAGENEIFLAVSDTPDSWAFVCRDLDAVFMAPGMTRLWEVGGLLASPESAVFDRERGAVYVSCFNGDCIARLAPDGAVVSASWVQGVRLPTGIAQRDGRLYVVERPGIAVVDLETGVVTARWPIPDATFPNDVALGADGALFVSDSQSNRIFRLIDGVAELWLESPAIQNPNGVHVDGDRLLVGVVSEGSIKAVDLATRAITALTPADPAIFTDGLVGDGRGGYLYSDYYGRIFNLHPDGTRAVVLDRRGPERFCADIAYDPETGFLLVPSFFDQRVTAYSLSVGAP